MRLATKFIKKIKLRTWIIIGVLGILLPIAGLRAVDYALGALPTITARWSLNDTQGITAQDSSTGDNDGTITNALWVDTARCLDGNCLYFDGDTDYISRNDDADFDFAGSDSFTFSMWFRHAPKTTGTDVMVAKFNTGDGDGGYKIQMEADGDITCAIDNDDTSFPSDSVTSTAATYDDNAWHQLSCVKNGSSSLTLYIDGLQIIQDASITSSTIENNETFYLGADNGGTTDEYSGYIDEFRLYRSALTAAQIKTDFNFGAALRFKENNSDFLTEGLIGYWNMNETSGNAADSSGNSNTLVNNSTTPFTNAKYSLGAELDGATDFFDLADNATVSQTGSITLAAWIIPDSVTGSHNIIGKWDGSNESFLLATEGDELRMYVETGNHQTTSSTNLVANSTYHVAGVYNSSTRTVSLYVNGLLQTSTTSAGTIPSSISDDAGEFSVGAEDTGGTAANFFDGHIDDARFYNRALNDREIQSLYTWAPGPVGYWKFDEGAGQTTYDSSSSGNNGSRGADGTSEATDPSWTGGKFGGALLFDGSDDKVTIGDPAILDISSAITVSAWVYRDVNGQYNRIVTKTDSGEADGFVFDFTGSNNVRFRINNNDCNSTTTIGTSAVWYHVAGTYDGANIRIYIDGNLDKTCSYSTAISTNNWNVVVGDRHDGNSRFKGRIDEVKIYNYARNTQQIVEDMNGGHPAGGSPIGSQVSYWKLNEQEGATSSDSVGSNHVTLTNSPAWSGSGKYNAAIDFERDNSNYLTVADNSSLSLTGSLSLSAWIKPESTTAATSFSIAGKGSSYLLEQYGDEIRMYIDGSGNYVTTNSANLQTGTWYHVMATYNATTQSVIIYINGVAVATTTTGTIPTSIADGSSAFRIGGVESGSTVNLQVGTGTDDGYDSTRDSNFNTGSPIWVGGKDAGFTVSTGLRFTNVTIPQGSTITAATLDFNENYGGDYTTNVKAKIYGDYQDDCATFGAGALPRSRTKTTAALDWDSNGSQGSAGSWYSASATVPPPSIVTIVQEIVDRGSWASGNDMCFIITDDGSTNDWYFETRSYEYTGNVSGPKLNITYSGVGGNYDGLIDEVKLYSSTLNPSQVIIDMNSGTNTNFATGVNEIDSVTGGAGNAPIGYWNFDENTLNTCTDGVEDICDQTGNGYDGDLTATFVPGVYGTGASFDGTNDNVIVDRVAALEPTQITIEAWFKSPGHATNFTRFISHGSSTGGYELILFPDSAGGYLEFNLGIGAAEHDVGSNVDLTDNNWHHVAATYDGTMMYLYIDGVRQTDTDATAGSINNYNTSNNLRFGEDENGTADYTGLLDEVKIYNYARTQSQVAYDYNRGTPIAYWKLNSNVSGNAQTMYDSGGKSLNGTTDDGANNTGMDCTVQGKFNYGCDIDGTDDFISVSDATSSYLDFETALEDFSLFAWVKRDTTGEQNILSFEEADNDGWRLQFNSSNQVVCSVDGVDITSSSVITADSTWHFVGCTIDRDGNGQTYIDGKANGSTQAISSEVMAITATTLYIGTRGYTAANYFNGIIDEIAIYNYVLSPTQIKKIYNQNSGARFGPNEGTP